MVSIGVASALVGAMLACDSPPFPAPPPTVEKSSASVAPEAVVGSAVALATAPPPPAPAEKPSALERAIAKLPPLKLARKAVPAARLADVKRSCDAGDTTACWAMAARYASEGRLAGCGVEREAPGDLKVGPLDAETDSPWRDYYVALACSFGDERGCEPHDRYWRIERFVYATDRLHPGLAAFVQALDPKRAALVGKLLDKHDRDSQDYFYALEKKAPHTLAPETRDAAIKACADTRDCADILMNLDQNGYEVAEVIPVRRAAGETMLDACLDGDCGCGEAALYLGSEDGRALDAARIGCEGGEADACFVMGQAFENGAGVAKDLDVAIALYEAACPPTARGDYKEEYSKLACDRLAAAYQKGDLFEASMPRALFYARRACTRPAHERDFAPCVRLAVELRRDHGRTGLYMNHPDHVVDTEGAGPTKCGRASVRQECKEYQDGNK